MARKKTDLPIFVADCETDPFLKGRVPVPFLWGLYDGSNYEEFTETRAFIEYISEIECIVYAHNGGKFDWHFITDWIEFGTDLMIINGRLASFKIGNAEFRDSWNILPVPLAQMQKTVVDYAIFEADERYKPHNWKVITSYLYDDCRFLFDYLAAFRDRFGLHLTLAGCAMKTWQAMTGKVAPKDDGGFIYDEFSRFYYGGRCQAFTSGVVDHDAAMVDINSAYPFAMLQNHPLGLHYDVLDYETFEKNRHDVPGDWFITVEGVSRGALPFRDDNGALFFPDDGVTRVFSITGWEFNALRDTGRAGGYIFHNGAFFRDLDNFSDFILPLYNERLACKASGDKKGDLVAKLCMNSLYGKFASNPRSYCKYRVCDPEKINNPDIKMHQPVNETEWKFSGFFGDLALTEKPLPEYEERFYNVATSASITGYVRAFLWRSICQCEGVLYCDTDSIIARDVSRLSTGKNLGDWQIENAFRHGGIGGKKLYAFEDFFGKWKHAAKGARLEPADIMRICTGETVLYESIAPTFSVHKSPAFVNRNIKATTNKK